MSTENITRLAKDIKPITPQTLVEQVAQCFLHKDYREILTLPVVVDGIVVGAVSRYDFMEVYLKQYGRDLYQRKPVSELMSKQPIRVKSSLSLEEASDWVTSQITFPIKEDFVITKNRRYYGMGVVLDLLKAMEGKLRSRQEQLDAAYKQLQESQAQLVQSSKMAALGTMVAGVAHEINTPLGYVRNNLEVLQSTFEQIDELCETTQAFVHNVTSEMPDEGKMETQMEALTDMIEDIEDDDVIEEAKQLYKDSLFGMDKISEIVMGLKNFSRLDQAMDDEVCLHECLDSTLVIANNVIKDKVTIDKQYADSLPHISCMPSKLNQVFLNIITNASQAIETHGTVTIVTMLDGDDHVMVKIKDNGSGIPDEIKDKVFDPFFTTKKVGEGTGMGMSISHQIIEQHGGEIDFDSTVGIGTEFFIRLPIRQTDTQNATSKFNKQIAV